MSFPFSVTPRLRIFFSFSRSIASFIELVDSIEINGEDIISSTRVSSRLFSSFRTLSTTSLSVTIPTGSRLSVTTAEPKSYATKRSINFETFSVLEIFGGSK